MTPRLYQPCEHCDKADMPRRTDGSCLGCGGLKFVEVGLTLGQVDGLIARSRRSYRADGGYEELHSEDAVATRRIEAAREIERLTAEVARLRAALFGIREMAGEYLANNSWPKRGSFIHRIEADARAALEVPRSEPHREGQGP